MKRKGILLLILMLSLLFSACGAAQNTENQNTVSTIPSATVPQINEAQLPNESIVLEQPSEIQSKESESMKIKITAGNVTFIAVPEENSSAQAFLDLLEEQPITVQMSDYAGMEKVGTLGVDLPRNDTQISVGAGDVILYQGNQITIYYGTNSWNFTKLAHIENATKESLLEALGLGDVEVTFSLVQ
jgi:hypothetical protein